MTTAITQRDPRLAFHAPEHDAPGMVVEEVDLATALSNPAPFQTSRWSVQPGCVSPVDSHSVHEIWMVARGSGELRYNGVVSRIEASDVLYFEPPKTHQVLNDGSGTLEIFSVWWKDARAL